MRITEKTKTIAILALPILFSAFALFYNLGDRLFWGDEAETALLGVNITTYGVPKATDGNNYITILGKGVDTNKDDVWVWRPWLDSYITAASFTLFGKSTTSARVPFVCIAFCSVLFFAWMTHRLYRKNEATLFALLLLITNVAFLLHARQCRYYALLCFAQMSFIYGYHRLLRGNSKSGIFYVALALIIEFHCNYILVVPNILAMIVSTLVIHRRHMHLIRNEFMGLGVFLIFVIPWLLYAHPWHQAGYMIFDDFAVSLLYRLLQINFYIVPLILFFVPVVMHFTKRRRLIAQSQDLTAGSMNIFLWSLVPAYLLIGTITPVLYFRYLIPLIPVFILLLIGIIVEYVRPKALRYLFVAVLSLSNIISALSAFPILRTVSVSMPIVRFVEEITSEYSNKLKDVVLYLRKNAHPGETLFVRDPEFPLIFYSDMRVIDARLNKLPDAHHLPDWIFAQSTSGAVDKPELQVPAGLEKNYELILLQVHDSPFSDNCPDARYHVSLTGDKFVGFKIYKKK